MNSNHANAQVGEAPESGRRPIAMGRSVTDTTPNAVANLGIDGPRLVAPVPVGDTSRSESLVAEQAGTGATP